MFEVVTEQSNVKQQSLVVVCAWCHRQRVLGPDLNLYWVETDENLDHDHVSHTICPTCKTKMTGQLSAVNS